MLNGLKITGDRSAEEALDFDALGAQGSSAQAAVNSIDTPPEPRRQETAGERRRREHEEYRRRRDADPAFIPTRGNFFMHDQRTGPAGQNGFRPYNRATGAGRGRNPIGRPFSPAASVSSRSRHVHLANPQSRLNTRASEPSSGPWAHDLHQTLMEPANRPQPQQQPRNPSASASASTPAPGDSAQAGANASSNTVSTVPPVRTFNATRRIGIGQIRVLLPGMEEPRAFPNVPFRLYARLPNHRPPLRRDKPVRVSLPGAPPRYIFPSTDRSFIFIPRALRPNQQGFGKGRGRGFGSVGGYSSRRTSIYGGSVYSPSVAMSRRSSIARDFNRDGLMSPSLPMMAGRPVVRLPPGSQNNTAVGTPLHSANISGTGTPVVNYPTQLFPPPPRPPLRENWPANMQMHQPRPQRTVSVNGIESPAALQYQPPLPPPDQQPFHQQLFHQQVPTHIETSAGRPEPPQPFFPPSQQMPFPNPPTASTPLSNIPERAIHAQPFQPFTQHGFQQAAFLGQPTYFFPTRNGQQPQYNSGAVLAPMFVPSGQHGGGYLVPTIAPAQPQQVQQPSTGSSDQGQMAAYEQNGTVYYYDPSQTYVPPEGYQPQNFAMPGMGGMMTQAPEGYFYPQGPVYYPPQ